MHDHKRKYEIKHEEFLLKQRRERIQREKEERERRQKVGSHFR